MKICRFIMLCQIGLFSAYAYSAQPDQDNAFPLKYPVLVNHIYQNHTDNYFWQEEPLRTEFEKQLMLFVLADVSDDLFVHYQALREAAKQKDWQRYERLATDSLLFYISYTEQLAVKGIPWLFGRGIKKNIAPPSTRSIDAFFNAPSNLARLKYLQRLLPESPQYGRLYQHVFDFYRHADKNATSAEFTAFAKQGERLQQKALLLARLQLSGDLSPTMKKHFESEDQELYSEKLQAVIKRFQSRHGLKVDAIIGKKTRYWLNISARERLRLMALNTLRLTLWTINKPRVVIVNIPDYTMEYWEEGEKKFESKAIVGRSTRKTPIFISKLDSIVFNPTWTVPISIMRKDILPSALADNDYLKKHRYQIIPSWLSSEVIDPEQIEWDTITVDNFPYKLRQKSGKNNALGFYKFNTPNKNAIYLHDTPAKYLFNKRDRAYSSGCIRIQKAKQFARLLMNESGFSDQDYRRYHERPKTTALGLKKKITFFTIYQTVWVDEFGFTQFRKDIYNYDTLRRSKNFNQKFNFQKK